MNPDQLRLPVELILAAAVAASLLYSVISVVATRHWYCTRSILQPDWTPGVTILKPVHGVDPESVDNFASFCNQEYPTDSFELIFGALTADDPALENARAVAKEFPAVSVKIIAGDGGGGCGANLKVCNLARMLPEARHDLIVLADSDMRVSPDYLRRIVAPFRENGHPGAVTSTQVGLVTAPYRGALARSFPSVLEAIGIGADFIPSAMVSRRLEGVGFAFGSTIVVPRKVIEEIGGFAPLADQLADDYLLGAGVRSLGYRAVLSDYVVQDVLGREGLKAMWARRVRWARTVRSCRPGGYAGAIVTHGLALSIALLLVSGVSRPALLLLLAVLFTRFAAAAACALYLGDRVTLRFLPLLPLSDLFSFAIYVASYCGRRITWRGRRFRLLRGGRMTPAD